MGTTARGPTVALDFGARAPRRICPSLLVRFPRPQRCAQTSHEGLGIFFFGLRSVSPSPNSLPRRREDPPLCSEGHSGKGLVLGLPPPPSKLVLRHPRRKGARGSSAEPLLTPGIASRRAGSHSLGTFGVKVTKGEGDPTSPEEFWWILSWRWGRRSPPRASTLALEGFSASGLLFCTAPHRGQPAQQCVCVCVQV